MKITLLPARQLTPDLVHTWSRFQQADAALESAFFRPEFTQAVAACRDDVEVAVLEQDGEIAGFFPFQRTGWNIGKPVGGLMSDFHGVIARPGLEYDATELMRGCRLSAWDFHNLIVTQPTFASHCWEVFGSPYMDLSKGFDAYYAGHRQTGSSQVENGLRKSRKMQREVGPVRFEPYATEPNVFDTLLAWKSEQYHRTHATNIFSFGWTAKLLKKLLEYHSEDFAGLLSALYVGDRLVAVHYGLRSGPVLHGWFPAYDTSFAAYSPGVVLSIELAKAAETLGIQRIDMCSGPGRYKDSLMSDARRVARGSVTSSLSARVVRSGWRHTKNWVRSSPLKKPAQWAGRLTRPLRGWLAFR